MGPFVLKHTLLPQKGDPGRPLLFARECRWGGRSYLGKLPFLYS